MLFLLFYFLLGFFFGYFPLKMEKCLYFVRKFKIVLICLQKINLAAIILFFSDYELKNVEQFKTVPI